MKNSTRKVVGTIYRPDRDRLHSLKQQIADGCDPSTTFREIHELLTEEGRVILFEIPPARVAFPLDGRPTTMPVMARVSPGFLS